MKLAHQIKLSVFSKQGDEEGKIKTALLALVPFEFGNEKIKLNSRSATGFKERKIRILEITLVKQRHTKAFLEFFLNKLSNDQKELLMHQRESRLDPELNFFIRLDKEKLQNGEYFITDSGNCFHIKISIAAFPSKREIALKIVEELLK